MMLTLKYMLLSLFFLAGAYSCVSAKNSSGKTEPVATASSIQSKLYVPRFSSMNAAKCKFSIIYKDKALAITSSVKMKKDSIIQLSLSPFLGIEMARIILRPDSVTIIDKNNHYYYTADYGILKTKFGVEVNFNDVQALLSNQPLNAPDSVATGIKPTDTGYDWLVLFRGMQADYQYDKDYRLTKTNLQQPSSDARFSCSYSVFVPVNDITFPTQLTVEAAYNQKQAGFTLSLDKITFNAPVNFTPVNLSDYNRVGFEQIIPF